MTVAEILQGFADLGVEITLTVDRTGLAYDAPRNLMTDWECEVLSEHKHALIAELLRTRGLPEGCP